MRNREIDRKGTGEKNKRNRITDVLESSDIPVASNRKRLQKRAKEEAGKKGGQRNAGKMDRGSNI